MLYRYNFLQVLHKTRTGLPCWWSQRRVRSRRCGCVARSPPGLDKCLEHHLLTNPRLNSSHTAMPMSNCFGCIYDLYTVRYFATHVYKLNICIYKFYLNISSLDQKSLKNILILSRNLGWSQQRFDLDYRIGMDRHLDGGLAAGFCVHTLFWVWIKHVWDSPKKIEKTTLQFVNFVIYELVGLQLRVLGDHSTVPFQTAHDAKTTSSAHKMPNHVTLFRNAR